MTTNQRQLCHAASFGHHLRVLVVLVVHKVGALHRFQGELQDGSGEAVEGWQRARCVRARRLQMQMECVDTCANMWTTREQTLTTAKVASRLCWTMTRHSAPGCSMSIGNFVLQVAWRAQLLGGWEGGDSWEVLRISWGLPRDFPGKLLPSGDTLYEHTSWKALDTHLSLETFP